ncbi:MAG TPA: long-chain fatty acid transporter, partial [Nitrospira sp.]|nr:long-chain fatty acid transporter [Nitrospira sp.]
MLVPHKFCHTLLLSLTLMLLGFVLLIPDTQAQTPRLQGQSASAAAMGNAFVAQADDPSALHYNPAGMTQLHGFQT